MGRNAPTPLPADNTIDPSSAMPWNLSASLCQRNTLHRLSRAGSASSAPYNDNRRLTSASPLIGRGSNLLTLPARLSRANSLAPGDGGAGATSSIFGGDFGLVAGFGTDNDTDMHDFNANLDNDLNAPLNTQQQEELEADFEAFGPAAQIDTQTAASRQWIKGVLDVEGRNFLEFVEAEVARLDADDAGDAGDVDGIDDRGRITFETLLPPTTNSAIVAAQGLLHCLALATKALLEVKQVEDFGEIWLRPLSVSGGGGGGREDGDVREEEGDGGVVV